MINHAIHTCQNGLRCRERTIYPCVLNRCRRHVNLHEPLQEVVFKRLLSRRDIRSYVNLGVGWGYYLLLARGLKTVLKLIGVDGDQSMIRAGNPPVDSSRNSAETAIIRGGQSQGTGLSSIEESE